MVKNEKINNPKSIREFFDTDSIYTYILDDNNAIDIIDNPDMEDDNKYIMIHYRLKDNELIEVNRWNQKSHYLKMAADDDIIQTHNLFMVQGKGAKSDSIYDYKNDKFIVEKGIWDVISTKSTNNKNYQWKSYLDEYNAFLAYFTLNSTKEEDDIIYYENPVTNEPMQISFDYSDGIYYALLNTDGSIRGNKLFKGKDFSRIERVINLNAYGSLAAFKQEKIDILNKKKKQDKEKYYKELERKNKEYISPYLDDEVLKVLKLNNRKTTLK